MTHYPVARTEADRQKAISRLEQFIRQGEIEGRGIVERVFRDIPQDALVPVERMQFVGGDIPVTLVPDGARHGGRMTFHSNALHQMGSKFGVPRSYVDDLNQTSWGRTLLAHNLQALAENNIERGTKFLTRSVDTGGGFPECRGFLSSRYRRMDSRPLVDSLLGAFKAVGAVLAGGHGGDTRIHLRGILPNIVEPTPGEFMVFGLDFGNSDYGKGAMKLSMFAERLMCLNGMLVGVEMRKVHLGARLDESIEYSRVTYELDTRTLASAIKDSVAGLLSAPKIDALSQAIAERATTEVKAETLVRAIRKDTTKQEQKAITDAFNSPEIELLPPGQTSWRFSNAISLIANQTDDRERAVELQALAGDVLDIEVAA